MTNAPDYLHGRPWHSYPSYPLRWPEGWPRTNERQGKLSKFSTEFNEAKKGIEKELTLMKAVGVVLSSNAPINMDGSLDSETWWKEFRRKPYKPVDEGVAVYFYYKDAVRVFACDKWSNYFANAQAIHKTIQAVRGVERWGTSEMLTRLYDSFKVVSPNQSINSKPFN